ncbi:MAG: D-alanyl-D-alanine carboxypeptidase [Parcubacteria group bacterium]|nr:D-alanyl-D-alanine carboxypeptidase [Parcubacteria group bacterium]
MSNILFTILFGIPQLFNFSSGSISDEAIYVSNTGSVAESGKENSVKTPQKINESLGVKLEAKSALVLDRESGEILFSKDSQKEMAMASITKIMTAIVALDSKINLEDTIIIENDFVELEGADIDLTQGENLKVKDLLYGTLIASGNDAASALALHTSGDLKTFIAKMNKKTEELNMENTHFANVSGLDTKGHYSTAEDLAILADYAFKNKKFIEVATTREYDIVPENNDSRHIRSTNKLLLADYPKLKAGKTGYTDNAGFCFLGLSDNGKGNQIITVILGEDLNGEQFQETKSLIDWTYKTYKWGK